MNYNRQEELYDTANENDTAFVVGTGATGSWVALALCKLGIKKLTMVDMDIIETHNIPNQLFGVEQAGMYKPFACEEICKLLGSGDTEISANVIKLSKENFNEVAPDKIDVMFCLVDSMAARQELFEAALESGRVNTFIETRMGLTGYRIYIIDMNNQKEIDKYKKSWYSDDEAEVSACGHSQSIVSTAMQCASHAVGVWLAKKNNAEYVPNEIILDVHSSFILSRQFDKKEN